MTVKAQIPASPFTNHPRRGMSTTTEEETTVEFHTENGSSGPMPLSEFQERAEEAIEAIREGRQLSLDVGGREPNRSSLKTSVDVLIPRQLRKGAEIRIALTGPDGELLAQTKGKVVGVTFEDEYKGGFIVGSERVHKVKLGL